MTVRADRLQAFNWLLWIVALAALARLAVMVLLPDQGFPDAGSYRSAGLEFRNFHLMTNPDIMPLYPLLVAVTGSGWGQKLADLALSLATVWLVYALAWRIYRNEAIALIAALFCALWPHLIFFAATGLTETLFTALVLGGLVAFYDRRYIVGSVLFVLGILTRPALEFFSPLAIILFSLVVHREGFAIMVKRLLTFAAVYVCLMAPWWLHNYAQYGEFIRLNSGGGYTLYQGNNPKNQSGGGITGIDADLGAFSAIEDPVKRRRAMGAAAIDYIKAEPGRFIAMMPVKFARLWRPWPYADEYKNPLIVVVSIASAVPAFILAFVGLGFTLRERFRPLLPCLAYVGWMTFVHVVTIGSVRYRVPLEPIVLVLAAAGLAALMQRVAIGRQMLALLPPATR